MSGRLRRMFILDFVLQGYQRCVQTMVRKKKKSLNIPVIFSYLTFLFEVQKSKLLFYVETIRLVQSLTLSVRDRAYSNEIEARANVVFSKQLVAQSRVDQTDFRGVGNADRKEENLKNKFIQVTDIKEAIVFDEKLLRAENKYFQLLEYKEKILVFLSSDVINLQLFRERCENYQFERNSLLEILQELNLINSKSHRLDALLVGFSDNLSFAVPKKYLFDQATYLQRKSKREKGKRLLLKIKRKEDRIDAKMLNQVNLFSKNSCVVFISLIDKPGIIRKAQNSFQGLFGFTVKEIIGKDISIIMPRYVGDRHGSILSDYVNKPFISKATGHSSFPFLLGRNKRGWAVPVSIHFKPDSMGKDDCGLVGFIEKYPSNNSYIMLKEGDLLVESISKDIYDRTFKEFISPHEMNKVYIIRVIPLLRFLEQISLQCTIEQASSLQFFETIAFFPKMSMGKNRMKHRSYFFMQKIKFEDMIWNLQSIDINEYELYRVSIKLTQLKNRHLSYHVLEVQSLLKIRSYSAIKEAFHFLQQQIEEYLKIKISFEKQLKMTEQLRMTLMSSRKIGSERRSRRAKKAGSTYNYSEFSQPTLMEDSSKHPKEESLILMKNLQTNSEQLDHSAKLINLRDFSRTDDQIQQSVDLSRNSRQLMNDGEHSPVNPQSSQRILRMNFSQKQDNFSDSERFKSGSGIGGVGELEEIDNRESTQIISGRGVDTNFSDRLLSKVFINSPSSQGLLFDQSSSTTAAGALAKRSAFSNLSLKLNQNTAQHVQFYQQQPSIALYTDIDDITSPQQKSAHFFHASEKYRPTTNIAETEQICEDDDDEIDDDDELEEETGNDDKQSHSQVVSVSVGVPQGGFHSVQFGGHTVDQTSTKYGSSMTQTSRLNIRRTILQKKENQALKTLKYFGAFSLICICSLTLFVYLEVLYQIDIAYVTFQYIPWPLMFRCAYSISSQYQGLVQIIKRNVFSNSKLDADYLAEIEDRADYTVSEISDLFLKYASGDNEKLKFFQDFTATQVKMIFNKDLNTVSGSKLINTAAYKSRVPMSMAYYLQTSVGYIFRYSKIEDNLYEQVVRLDNVSALISNITTLDQKIYDQCDSILTTLSNQAFIMMAVVIAITFLLIMSVFPLYWHVQKKNESILKLFATIKQDHLDDMIRPLNLILETARKIQRITLAEHSHFSRFPKKKKKYSTTSKLPKFKAKLAIFSAIFFTSIIIQPIVNYISIIGLSDEVKANIILIRTIYDLRAQEMSTNSQNYQYLLYRMDSTYQLYNIAYYTARIPNLITQNASKLSNMINVVSNSQRNTNRYQQEKFDNFFYKIFSGNLCEAMRDNTEFISSENEITYTWCTEVRNGKLTQGFTLAFEDYLEEFKILNGLYAITDSTKFKASTALWESSVDFKDFDDFNTIISRTLNVMKDFMIQMMSDQLMYNQYLQTGLFIYQYSILIFIFYFGWIQFYSSITNEMHEIKKLLSIIDIQIVLESQHILNYLNR